ncbi:MAG: HpcH/HpaI aldolase/citrate lyase family protein [Acidobacteria bacterium]|nr:HpcH/HpaI aldolase/citrate lyase family protein [Acidobacteriota bacterium]MBE3132973.1 HpcH/HpaI aldolase/citrate lyase family protein [Acidobacteriota bacterium]
MDRLLRLRRSLLYVPGNMPAMLQNIPVFNADGVMIDLEDAVPPAEKDAARTLTRNFLRAFQDRSLEVFVRINGLDTKYALDDLREVLPALPDGIRLPKADSPEVVERLDTLLTEYEERLRVDIGRFLIIPSIESAVGVLNCVGTARASRRIVALAFGAEDYTASMEIQRTRSGEELFSARTQVVWAAKAAGVQAIDSVFSDVNDVDGLRAETALVKTLGFTGKSLVNPRQIETVHEVFRPKPEEIEHALEVMDVIRRAHEMGTGVISLRGRMVDAPVVKRAARTLRTAIAFGMIEYELSEELIDGQE